MTTTSGCALEALAGRVEALTGPDREVDAAIKQALGLAWNYAADWGPRGHDKPVAFAYTASLDAAMTLVPEGWGWLVSQPNEKAIASGLLKERTPVLGEVQYGCDLRFAVAAATPALALCAASLRARAALEKSNG